MRNEYMKGSRDDGKISHSDNMYLRKLPRESIACQNVSFCHKEEAYQKQVAKKRFLQQKHLVSASYTVEASLLFPLITVLIISLVYVTCFVYNRAMLTEYAYMAAMEGAGMTQESNRAIQEFAEEKARDLLCDQLLFVESTIITTKVNYSYVMVTYMAKMDVPKGILLDEDYFNLSVTMQAKRRRPIEFMRLCKKLKAISEYDGEDNDVEAVTSVER